MDHGVRTVSVPFDISAEFLPDLLRKPDKTLERLAAGLPVDAPEFDDIIHQSEVMQRVVLKARRIAPRSIPVLIEGESGTGKELFARAIHDASPRNDKPFVAINCGAIPCISGGPVIGKKLCASGSVSCHTTEQIDIADQNSLTNILQSASTA